MIRRPEESTPGTAGRLGGVGVGIGATWSGADSFAAGASADPEEAC